MPHALMPAASCPLCGVAPEFHSSVETVDYFDCGACDFIFADPAVLGQIDAGTFLRDYDSAYWISELSSARERSYGSSLARVAEALLYCRIPVNRFIDIGTGPGYLLDALATYLPKSRRLFYGVEKFPPSIEERSNHENYLWSDLSDLTIRFECGVCVEVLEHLTPSMARKLAHALSDISVPGSLFLFNTGLTEFVRREDPGYLDPYRRGHITSWSVTAARRVFEPLGFRVHPLRGKSWAFLVEMLPVDDGGLEVRDRIWTALDCNRAILTDPDMGSPLYILGMESARAY